MNNIAICIPTFKRPLLLKKLLLSILSCKFEPSLIKTVNIIIVDNDTNKTAEETVIELKDRFSDTVCVNYFCYPIKGLSNVRNELLKQAFLLHPDFISFIDDDEFVIPEWLNELVKMIIISNADAVRGPVLAITDLKIPEYIWCWFERERYPDGSRIYSFKTGNLMIKRTSLLKFNIWFDSRFNTTGAEDSYFGAQMLKKRATIFWSDKAITYESIPEERTRISWLMKRNFRGASNFVYELKLEKQYLKLLIKSVISLAYIISGSIALALLLFPIKRKLWGILKVSEGLGGIAGILNLRYNGY